MDIKEQTSDLAPGRIRRAAREQIVFRGVAQPEFCSAYDDMWAYYYDPFGGYVWATGVFPPPGYHEEGTVEWWKKWCHRTIRFTYDPVTPSVTDLQAFDFGGYDPGDHTIDPSATPLPSFWFTPVPEAVAELLTDVITLEPPPAGATLRITIYMYMMRKMVATFDSGGNWIGSARDEPVDPDETYSIPLVSGLCYTIL